jgi:site-specific recombinase XerD
MSAMWDYWICLYTQTHCTARGLRPLTIAAYQATLRQFEAFVIVRLGDKAPDQVTARDVLEYLEHLRRERLNGDSAINRQITVLKNFYRAIVAMGHLLPAGNPLAHFPKIKAQPRKLPVVLSEKEVERLLDQPGTDTILGLRDRAILALFYSTGIRASECAGLKEEHVDLEDRLVKVRGKGGHERSVPLNERACRALQIYRKARGPRFGHEAFFESCRKKPMGRGAMYERVKRHALACQIPKRVSPHRLRHTFATHLVKADVRLVTIRDLLGHRQITSTQIYLHVTAEDLRHAADRHPIQRLAATIGGWLPDIPRPVMKPPLRSSG